MSAGRDPRDPQGRRWEVFKQDAPDRPHQAIGTVHAADPEHALLTARHVFARRPRAVSLWVAPADACLLVTAEELAEAAAATPGEGPARSFQAFRKSSHRPGLHLADHLGTVEAPSARDALRVARERWDDAEALAWLLVPEERIVRSDPGEVDAWFAPAEEKTYKQQSQYGTVAARKRPPAP